MTMSKKAKKAGALIALAIITLIILGAVLTTDLFDKKAELPPPPNNGPVYPTEHLSIDASFLLKTGETNESVNVSCDLFMTNIWEKESGEIKATAYVSEKNTNFAVNKSTVEFGVIGANSTMEMNIPVKFSHNSYKVEILIFESNKLVKKVTLSINSYQNYYYTPTGGMVINKGRTQDDIDRDGQWSIDGESPVVSSIH